MKHVKLFEDFINEAKLPSAKDVTKAVRKDWKSLTTGRVYNNMVRANYQMFSKPIAIPGSEVGIKDMGDVLLLGVYDWGGIKRMKKAQYAGITDKGSIRVAWGIELRDDEFSNIMNKYGKDLFSPSKDDIMTAVPLIEDFLTRKLEDYLKSVQDNAGEGILGDLTKEFMKSADSIKAYKDGTIVLRFLQNTEEVFYQVNLEEQEVGFYTPELDEVREVETYTDAKQLIQIIKSKVAAWRKKNIAN